MGTPRLRVSPWNRPGVPSDVRPSRPRRLLATLGHQEQHFDQAAHHRVVAILVDLSGNQLGNLHGHWDCREVFLSGGGLLPPCFLFSCPQRAAGSRINALMRNATPFASSQLAASCRRLFRSPPHRNKERKHFDDSRRIVQRFFKRWLKRY